MRLEINVFGERSLRRGRQKEENTMLWTIILILLVLWALGFGFAGAAVGNLIHLLLVIAVIVLLVQLITGRRPAV